MCLFKHYFLTTSSIASDVTNTMPTTCSTTETLSHNCSALSAPTAASVANKPTVTTTSTIVKRTRFCIMMPPNMIVALIWRKGWDIAPQRSSAHSQKNVNTFLASIATPNPSFARAHSTGFDSQPVPKFCYAKSGGRGGIRTHGTVAGTTVFKTVSLNHSDTLPYYFLWRCRFRKPRFNAARSRNCILPLPCQSASLIDLRQDRFPGTTRTPFHNFAC